MCVLSIYFYFKESVSLNQWKNRANAYGNKLNNLHTVALYILFFFGILYCLFIFLFSFLVEKKTLLSVTKKFIVEVMNLLQTH